MTTSVVAPVTPERIMQFAMLALVYSALEVALHHVPR